MAEEFGPYLLEEVIGRGGMGVVYRAFDTRRDRTVALKRLPRELAADENFQARFRRESKLAARLNEPHIIPIHDFGEIDGQLYIDMRLVEGLDLGKLIADEGGALSPELAVDVIAQVASALAAAHTAGLMHRDIKPSNVLITGVTPEDRTSPFAYLVDFGIARAISGAEGTALTTTTDWFGTVAYMAPERISGSSGDSRSDIYSLACLLYQCLTGQAPFTGEALQVLFAHVNNAPPSAGARRESVPAGLDAVIRRGMAKKPEDRYQTVSQFAAAAKGSIGAAAAATGETQVVPTATRPIQTRPAGPPQSLPPRAGPPNSLPPQTGPYPAGPPQSLPPRAGPPNSLPPYSPAQNSIPPRSGPPNSLPPRSGPANSLPPRSGPANSIPPYSGPPHSIPPRPGQARPAQGGDNRALLIMLVIAVVVVVAAIVAVVVSVSGGGDSNAGGSPTPSARSGSSGAKTSPVSSSNSLSSGSSSGSGSSLSSTQAWGEFADFTLLIGRVPEDTGSAYKGATCALKGPDTGVTGMVEQVECTKLDDDSGVVFYVGRFTGKAAVDDYVAALVKRKYAKTYWTIDSKRRGQLLTSPSSASYADVTSSICEKPTFLVQFYASDASGISESKLESEYWRKSIFPDGTPEVCT